MKLVSFVKSGEERLGFLAGDIVVDPLLASGDSRRCSPSALSFIKSGDAGLKAARADPGQSAEAACLPTEGRRAGRAASARRPSCAAAATTRTTTPRRPTRRSAARSRSSSSRPPTASSVPTSRSCSTSGSRRSSTARSSLAIVIGKAGRFIPVERALEHVFGYTIVNDVTARDRQVRRTPEGMTWYELGSGKAFDSERAARALHRHRRRDRRSAEAQGACRASTANCGNRAAPSNMIWTCAELIHFFSRNFTLKPGMVIITGTPAGTAWSADKELGGKGVTQPGLVAGDALLPAGRRGRMRGRGHRRAAQPGRGGERAVGGRVAAE